MTGTPTTRSHLRGTLWTTERDQQAQSLRAAGHSSSQIATIMGGTTRNGVIGRLSRLGIKMPPQQARTHRVPKLRCPKIKLTKAGHVKPPKPPVEQVHVPQVESKPLLDRRWNECSWIVDDSDAHLMCCAPVTRGSWCEAHNVQGRSPIQPRVRRPVEGVRLSVNGMVD